MRRFQPRAEAPLGIDGIHASPDVERNAEGKAERTLNIERPTSNVEWERGGLGLAAAVGAVGPGGADEGDVVAFAGVDAEADGDWRNHQSSNHQSDFRYAGKTEVNSGLRPPAPDHRPLPFNCRGRWSRPKGSRPRGRGSYCPPRRGNGPAPHPGTDNSPRVR